MVTLPFDSNYDVKNEAQELGEDEEEVKRWKHQKRRA